MKATHLVAAATALSLICLAVPAEASCKCKPQSFPTVLEAVVVTEKGAYTLAEWEAKQAAKQQLAATPTVYFQPVIVTPEREELAVEEHRDYAHARVGGTSGGHAQAALQPATPWRPTLVNFLRRLLF